MTITRETTQISVADGSTMTIQLSRPDPEPAGNPLRGAGPAQVGVIVAHELFGVNPDIRTVTDRLAEAGYLAVAPEFYHRHAAAGRWLERDDAGRAEGFDLLHSVTRPDAVADVSAAAQWLLLQPNITEVAAVGFSAGGHLAYLAASQLPLSATAVLYGGWLPGTDIPMSRPTPTLSLTPGITGRVLYLVGDDDALIDAEQRGQIRDALAAANIDHAIVSYPDTEHAFFWPGTAAYNGAARDDAWARILQLLDRPSAVKTAGRARNG
jgi:carboxymethylenebutenolidase